MPDFPDELVEAAAKAAMEAEPGQNWECATAKEADVYLRDSLAVLTAVLPLIEQRARLDERERLSSRVHENGWCPTCARDTDEAAMQRLAGKSLESLSRNDLIGLALRNLNAAMDAEARADAAEQRVIDRLAREAGEPEAPDWYSVAMRAAWFEGHAAGAACGVAAEREKCPLCNHEWRRHDPEDGMCDCHDETAIGPCRCGRDLAWMQERIAAMSGAAISSPADPDTGEGT